MAKCPPNTYWVVPNKFLAGEYPGDRDEDRAQKKIHLLLDCGVNCFIDLTESGELEAYDPLLPKNLNIIYKRFPIHDVSVPASKKQMIEILDFIDESIENGKTVYVHCWGGIGRTGTVVGCYYSRHGSHGEKALAELKKAWNKCEKSKRSDSPENEEQRDYIIRWEE